MIPLGNALTRIRDNCGEPHYRLTTAVIIDNYDVRQNDNGIRLFSDSMDYINDNVVYFHRDPLRHLR